MNLLLSLALLLSLVPDISISWLSNSAKDAFTITPSGDFSSARSCVSNGLQYRYRVNLKLCSRRPGWFDRCGKEVSLTRNLDYKPLEDSYVMASDILGDDTPPEEVEISDQDQAIKRFFRRMVVPYKLIATRKKGEQHYVRAKVLTECRGSTSKTLRQLTSILTFGIVATDSSEGEWHNFYLDEKK